MMLAAKSATCGFTLLLVIVSMTVSGQAMSDAHRQGMSLAQGIPFPQPGSVQNVTGYAGTDLPQSGIKAHDLGEQSAKAFQSDEASRLIAENFDKGERFVIDPHTDPLILSGNEIVKDPGKVLEETVESVRESRTTPEETKVCEESGEETLEEGEETRIVEVPDPQPWKSELYVYSHGWAGGLARNVLTDQKLDGSTVHTYAYAAHTVLRNPLPAELISRVKSVAYREGYTPPWWASLSQSGVVSVTTARGGWFWINKHDVLVDISLKPGEENVVEHIRDNCGHWEERAEQGLCSYEEVIVVEGPQTRIVNGYPVSRDWWRRKKRYRCHYPAKNDCAALRAKGCYQVHSTCKEKVRDVCVVWEQTYRCPGGKVSGRTYRSSGKMNLFCLSGDCADQTYGPNSDLAQVMSHMSVLKEAGDDLKNLGSIFKGSDRRCTRHCVSFKDCCGNGDGWGVSLKLASCDATEKELAELRGKNRCIQVGTYCAEKKLGVCIRKKTTFCCYGTKLAKIVQEQGKRQLGLGFGSPEHPECQGLTAEQLSRIDFSQINFSEILSEVMGRTKPPSAEKLVSGLKQSMEIKGSLLKPSSQAVKDAPKGAPGSETTLVQGHPRDQF